MTWRFAEIAGEMLSLGWEKEDAEPKLVLWREGWGGLQLIAANELWSLLSESSQCGLDGLISQESYAGK